jgi:hypothetical protein
MSGREVYELMGIVRQPHHMTYSYFPESEWGRTILWTIVFGASAALLHRVRAVRALVLVVLGIALLCGAGAWSSAHGEPLILFLAQTARLTSFVPALAMVCAAAALFQLGRGFAIPVLVGIFLISPRATADLGGWFPSVSGWVTLSAVEAGLVLVALGAFFAASRVSRPWALRLRQPSPRLAAVLGATAIVVAFASLLVLRDDRSRPRPPEEIAAEDIGHHAQALVPPGTLVVTPPTLDGFRWTALRPDVVEFGSTRLGKGDLEWSRRVVALTGPLALDPRSFGTDEKKRAAYMDRTYEQKITSSRKPICAYKGKFVVAFAGFKPPSWLRPVYRNSSFELLRVRPGTCVSRTAARA